MLVVMPKIVKKSVQKLKYRGFAKVHLKNGKSYDYSIPEDAPKLEDIGKVIVKTKGLFKNKQLISQSILVENIGFSEAKKHADRLLLDFRSLAALVFPVEETRQKSINPEEILMIEVDLKPTSEHTDTYLEMTDRDPISAEQALEELRELGISENALVPLVELCGQ